MWLTGKTSIPSEDETVLVLLQEQNTTDAWRHLFFEASGVSCFAIHS